MPRWLARLFYAGRGKRLVRIHLQAPSGRDVTVEGVELGRWAGHYVLVRAKVISGEEQAIALAGETAEIPAERVIFRQVMSS